MSHFFGLLFISTLYGPALVTGFFSTNALGAGSYQRKATRSEVVFLRPVALVIFGVTLALNLLELCVLVDDPALFNLLNWSYFSTHPNAAEIVLAFGAAAFVLYWGVICWYIKTCALVLNLDRRTYRTIDTAGIVLKEKTGPWSDIAGISVRRTSNKGGTFFYVHLKWHGETKLASSLGGFSKLDRAGAFAAQMARELDLPLVA